MTHGRIGRRENIALFTAALLAAIGGLIYELILGTAASYLLGDSVLSFSLATGITLFGMGIGSLLVNRFRAAPAVVFGVSEVLLGLIGGNSVLLLYLAFGRTRLHWVVFGGISLTIGILIGLEIPLLVSLVFPLVLLPQLGLMRGAYLVGALNVLVALLVLLQVRTPRKILWAATAAVVALVGMFAAANRIERSVEALTYNDPIVYYQQTAYQKVVLTQYQDDLRLYLNGQLQFSSLDEARYHETLSASAMTSVKKPAHVLVLGGGDGLLAREILRYPSVTDVTIVDIDPDVTELARNNRLLKDLNHASLSDPRVKVVNDDAFTYVQDSKATYDVALIDLVDPSNEKLAKLYSTEFYRNIEARLAPEGVMVTQATSTFFSPHAFSTVASTVTAAQPDRQILPFSTNIPSFGEWGFVLSTRTPQNLISQPLPKGLTYQDRNTLEFIMRTKPARTESMEPSTLLHPRIVEVYNQDMRQWRYY